jgi:prephenate dehydrogenase
MDSEPLIGIVGSQGAYGRWLQRFFTERMGLVVLGHDPADPASATPQALVDAADVLVFAAPIRSTAAIVREYTALAGGCERGRLWLDVTSIKQAPIAALLESQAEVVGLHPMAAPPKGPTLRGRALVVCEARLEHWRPWLSNLLAALEADCVKAGPEQHDAVMALVQGLVHAVHLAQVAVLRETGLGVDDLWPFRSVSCELDLTVAARMLAGNPSIYEDIQFCNPAVAPMLRRVIDRLARLADLVDAQDGGRDAFRADFIDAGRAWFGAQRLASGNYGFERIGYLLADLGDPQAISVHLPDDRPGALRDLLTLIAAHGINLGSIHSSRTPEGEVHFRIGVGSVASGALQALRDAIAAGGYRCLDTA